MALIGGPGDNHVGGVGLHSYDRHDHDPDRHDHDHEPDRHDHDPGWHDHDPDGRRAGRHNVRAGAVRDTRQRGAFHGPGALYATCHDQATETLTETLKGKQIASVSAADQSRGGRVVKKQPRYVASVTITIADGATRNVTLKLNPTGAKLLARFARLPVRLTLTQRLADGKLRTIKSVKLTLKDLRRSASISRSGAGRRPVARDAQPSAAPGPSVRSDDHRAGARWGVRRRPARPPRRRSWVALDRAATSRG